MSGVGDTPTVETETEQSDSSKWWIPIFLLAIDLPLLVLLFVVASATTQSLVMEPENPFDVLFYLLVAAGWLLTVLSPIAVYFDRQYVASLTEWTPSKLYYLMIFPFFINTILAIAYIYNRHRYLGMP